MIEAKTQYQELADSYQNKLPGYYENERREMLAFVPRGISSLLEVGCSSGAFAALVKAQMPDCEVWGVEPSTDAAAKAKGRIDHTICGLFEPGLAELNGKKFDCVVFNDVLEHLADPGAALNTARQYLNQKGKVVASIPNVLHFYNISKIIIEQDWKYESEGIMDNTHLRFFTKKSILRMFNECGFAVETIQGINPSYGLKYKVANALVLGRLSDWRFVQFAVVASKVD